MMKRQRHYSEWEIAGLVGSTVILIFKFFGSILAAFDMLGLPYGIVEKIYGAYMFLISMSCISLAYFQWYEPRLKFVLFLILGSLLSILFWPVISIFDTSNFPTRSSLALILNMSLTVLIFAIPIWMNRSRWRKVTPSQIEAFE